MKRAFPLAGGAPVLVVFICAAAIRSEPQPPATLQEVQAQPHVMFISVLPGAFGRVGLVPLSRPDASPVITDLVCHRLSFAAGQGLCMFKEYEGDRYPAFAFTFRSPMQRERKIDLAGRPSRTRISPGGRYGAMTVFVVGDSYSCDFSTRTTLIDMRDGRAVGDLEKFTVRQNGQRRVGKDFNFWGVTFTRDENRFFATLGTAGKTYLVSGDVRTRTLNVLREGVECPSLSPDGTRIAFKSRIGKDDWRLHVLDLASLKDRPIAGEAKSIDDQVEWLDDGHVLYGFVADTGLPENAANVWVASVQDDGPARIFIHSALSPVVVR